MVEMLGLHISHHLATPSAYEWIKYICFEDVYVCTFTFREPAIHPQIIKAKIPDLNMAKGSDYLTAT